MNVGAQISLMSDAHEERKPAEPSTLGAYLKSLRSGLPMTLREVEEATDKDVSNAYLSQLENDKIAKPSPNILYTLADVYGASYERLMEKAGYISPGLNAGKSKHGRAPTYAVDNLTPDEERELLKYLDWYRSRKQRS
jgi:transcriptional regulator with XRE-family HTH domain